MEWVVPVLVGPSRGRTNSGLSGVRTEHVVTLVQHVAADGQEQVERQGVQSLTSHCSEAIVHMFIDDNTDTFCLGDIV